MSESHLCTLYSMCNTCNLRCSILSRSPSCCDKKKQFGKEMCQKKLPYILLNLVKGRRCWRAQLENACKPVWSAEWNFWIEDKFFVRKVPYPPLLLALCLPQALWDVWAAACFGSWACLGVGTIALNSGVGTERVGSVKRLMMWSHELPTWVSWARPASPGYLVVSVPPTKSSGVCQKRFQNAVFPLFSTVVYTLPASDDIIYSVDGLNGQHRRERGYSHLPWHIPPLFCAAFPRIPTASALCWRGLGVFCCRPAAVSATTHSIPRVILQWNFKMRDPQVTQRTNLKFSAVLLFSAIGAYVSRQCQLSRSGVALPHMVIGYTV